MLGEEITKQLVAALQCAESELAQIDTNLERNDQERIRLNKSKEDVNQEIAGLKQALEARERRVVVDGVGTEAGTTVERSVAASRIEGAPRRAQHGEKSIFIRNLMQQNPGLTGAEMRESAVAEFGIVPKNFPWTQLKNWIDSGIVRKDGKQYFFVDARHT